MRKQLLIKFIEGRATPAEQEQVLVWIDKEEENRKYFLRLKNLYVISSLPIKTADKKEFFKFRKEFLNISQRSNSIRFSFLRIASIFLLVIAIALNFYQYFSAKEEINIGRHNSVGARKMNTLSFYTNKGVKGVVTLPDS
ncbi:MAG: hypothetical protein Q8S04_09445, partial [Bacteroidales bacterium]|nr:hypothetical protein [Bacteroidales bacterium]